MLQTSRSGTKIVLASMVYSVLPSPWTPWMSPSLGMLVQKVAGTQESRGRAIPL